MSFKTWFVDTLERVGWTFLQVFSVVYISAFIAEPINSVDGGHQLADLGWVKAATVAGIAAGYTVLKQALLQTPTFAYKWADYVFRVASTFVVTAGAVVTADGFNLWNIDGWQTAALAGIVAAAALVKGWIADKAVKGTITPLSTAKA